MENSFILFFLGAVLLFIGFTNIGGEISTVKWLQRRNVAPENEKPFGRLMGAGTVLCGVSVLVLSLFYRFDVTVYLVAAGLAIGVGLMLCACLKYNRGLW